jgi:hypothetical protein
LLLVGVAVGGSAPPGVGVAVGVADGPPGVDVAVAVADGVGVSVAAPGVGVGKSVFTSTETLFEVAEAPPPETLATLEINVPFWVDDWTRAWTLIVVEEPALSETEQVTVCPEILHPGPALTPTRFESSVSTTVARSTAAVACMDIVKFTRPPGDTCDWVDAFAMVN